MKRPTAVIDSVWLQRAHEAFRASIDASGAETKVMAAWLVDQGFWPALGLDAAVSKFRHAYNGTHGERFRTLEVIALATQFGGDALLRFWAESMGCRIEAVPNEAIDAALVESFDARLAQIEQGVRELAQIRALMHARNEYDAREAARTGGARVMFGKDGPL